MYGWAGQTLRVDLSSGELVTEPLDYNLRKEYIGGRGINSKIAYDEIKPGTDPLSPENVLIVGTGPLAGTLAPSGCKLNITAMSPLTNILGYSNVGGEFAPSLKWAGYDHIIIKGKSSEPVYLWIDDDRVELQSAKHLWGKSTAETVRMVREEFQDPTVELLTIGQAGENLVRFACVISKFHRAAGRTGMGAVMGSKNLKAIAVRGTGSVQVARPKDFVRLVKEATQKIMNSPVYPLMSVYGSSGLLPINNEQGTLLVRNWQQSGGFKGIEDIGPEGQKKYFTKSLGCFACPIHCSHHWEVKEGPFAGESGGGMEYGVGGYFAAFFDNAYTPSLFKILNIVNGYGMDSMDLSAVLGAAFEWYEKGIITQDHTDGLPLEWGDYHALVEMIHKVGKREGIGDLLAKGSVEAAQKIGSGAEKSVSHCKGMTFAGIDLRPLNGCSLAAVTCTRGGDIEEGICIPEIAGMPPEECKRLYGSEEIADPTTYNKKAETVYLSEVEATITDCVEICKFSTRFLCQELKVEDMGELFRAATGMELDTKSLHDAADRIYNLERAFLVREGITKKDDCLIGPWGEEPVKSGPFKGERIDPKKFRRMLEEYYALRGWDKKTGIPTRAVLERLGLQRVADDLEKMEKLPGSK